MLLKIALLVGVQVRGERVDERREKQKRNDKGAGPGISEPVRPLGRGKRKKEKGKIEVSILDFAF